jgi:membrane protein YdbS with pleckstrin-like domain
VGFPEDYMSQDEELILNLRPHWWQMAMPTAVGILALIVFLLIVNTTDVDQLTWLGGLALLAALAWGGAMYLRWVNTYFVLSSERLITRSGFISKRGVEIPLGRINNVNFQQSLFERIIGAGDLLIESAGESGQSRLSNVRKPDAVQNAILLAMDDYRNRAFDRVQPAAASPVAPPAPAPNHPSIPEQIAQLDDLRQRGAITEVEFQEKKAELLRRM